MFCLGSSIVPSDFSIASHHAMTWNFWIAIFVQNVSNCAICQWTASFSGNFFICRSFTALDFCNNSKHLAHKRRRRAISGSSSFSSCFCIISHMIAINFRKKFLLITTTQAVKIGLFFKGSVKWTKSLQNDYAIKLKPTWISGKKLFFSLSFFKGFTRFGLH